MTSTPPMKPDADDGSLSPQGTRSDNRWRRLPTIVKAWQYRGGPLMEDDPFWVAQGTEPIWNTTMLGQVDALAVRTLHGVAVAKNRDWIIQGPNGDYWPCKPDIFAATYEPVAEVAAEEQVLASARATSPQGTRSDELIEIVARDLLRAAGASLNANDDNWPGTVAHYRAMVAAYGENYEDARSLIHDAMRNARVAIQSYQKATGGEPRGEANTPSSPDAVLELVEALERLMRAVENYPGIENSTGRLAREHAHADAALSRYRGR